MRRGIDTSEGEAGFCEECQTFVPEGPDACLGNIPGVCLACCGHGDDEKAYVVLGDYPDGDWLMLEGIPARMFFALVRTAR